MSLQCSLFYNIATCDLTFKFWRELSGAGVGGWESAASSFGSEVARLFSHDASRLIWFPECPGNLNTVKNKEMAQPCARGLLRVVTPSRHFHQASRWIGTPWCFFIRVFVLDSIPFITATATATENTSPSIQNVVRGRNMQWSNLPETKIPAWSTIVLLTLLLFFFYFFLFSWRRKWETDYCYSFEFNDLNHRQLRPDRRTVHIDWEPV